MAYLDDTGLAYFWGKIKAWANSVFALLGHTHPSSDVTAMTGYSLPSSSGAISSGDTLNQAVGKLEKAVVDADISNVVHRTGDEEVSGIKAMKGNLAGSPSVTTVLGIRHSGVAKGTTPSATNFADLLFLDDSFDVGLDWAGRLGSVEHTLMSSGSQHMAMHCFRNDNTIFSHNKDDFTDPEVNLLVGYDVNGVPYATAPATSSQRADSTDIVTRGWIPQDVRIVHTSGNETISGTKTFASNVEASLQLVLYNTHYKVFLRNDDVTFYILLSDYDGSGFNSKRPFYVNLSTGNVHLEGGNRAAFWTSGNLYIYVSKDGSDDNDGLTSSTPVLTFNRALQVASRFSLYNQVIFRVGPGEWGDVNIFGATVSGMVVVANWTNDLPTTVNAYNALTGDSTPPHFTSITAYDCYFRANAIKVDHLCVFTSELLLSYTNSFGQITLKNSYCSISAPYIVHSQNTATDAVFIVADSYLNHGAVASTFSGTVTRSSFVRCDSRASISINAGASWTGTFSGNKFYSNCMASIPSGAKSPADFPGTSLENCIIALGYQLSQRNANMPRLTLVNSSASKSSAPDATKYWNLNMACGDAIVGDLSNSIAYVQAAQQQSGSNHLALVAVKPYDSSVTTAALLAYNIDGSHYFQVNDKLIVDGTSIITAPEDGTDGLKLFGSNHTEKGGGLWLYANGSSFGGAFRLRAATNGTHRDLIGSPNGYLSWYGREYRGDGSDTQYVRFNGGSTHNNGASLLLTGKSFSGYSGKFELRALSTTDMTTLSGVAGGTLSWDGQTIQTTSDERRKDFISGIPDDVLDAWDAVEWVRFKYRADIARKGEERCRWHSGLVAQRVESACAGAGVDILSYGMLCHDQSVIDMDTDARKDLWMARYEEALCMEAAYMRRENARLKARVSSLEERLAALEALLSKEE